ncbi:MAG: GNAT family N-acetyltransferase [Pyrinomonadaceae bacterium MAG19_C2-C3]|nr:GNAT family N-acetyltransferase [Pyrinomonadaceae bacterium MAG19_C2-C3]
MNITIKRIAADETRPLRHLVLRPDKPAAELVYPGDDAPEAAHYGAMLDDEVVGIATIHREPMPDDEATVRASKSWRLRGMATAEKVRRIGLGGKILTACIEHVRANGDVLLWCNARLVAVEFYQAYGFQTRGEPFDIQPIGMHYVMWREVK